MTLEERALSGLIEVGFETCDAVLSGRREKIGEELQRVEVEAGRIAAPLITSNILPTIF